MCPYSLRDRHGNARNSLSKGYGVKLDTTYTSIALVAFCHKTAQTKNAFSQFMIYTAPKDQSVHPMEIHQVGVNFVCYDKSDQRLANSSDEGVAINPGVQVMTEPLKFLVDRCMKLSYPHSHNGAFLIDTENQPCRQTLLRMDPDVAADNTLLGFPPREVYPDRLDFRSVLKMSMRCSFAHRRPLHKERDIRGRENDLLYLISKTCPSGIGEQTMAFPIQP